MKQNKPDNERKMGTGPLRRNTVEGVAGKSSLSPFSFDKSFRELFDGACNDTLTDEQFDRLDAALAASEDARREYLRYFTLNGEMRYLVSMGQADQAARERTGAWGSTETCFAEPPPAELLGNSLVPPSPAGFFQGMAENFAPDWARAYLLAAAVLGLFLLAASIIQVSRHTATNLPIQSAENTPGETKLDYVARITGMKDCDWIDPESEPFAGAMIPPGREFALSAGLLEITYVSGARVILEGPCFYEVDSKAGGYLVRGKLVARVEKRREKREVRSGGLAASAAIAKPQVSNSQSLIPNPQSLFSVTTPTAVVTDLGTEFGVEVDTSGNTTSHVFQGLVRFQAIGGGSPKSVMLRKNDTASAQIGPRGTTVSRVAAPSKFVRRMVEPPKIIDLLDIVAGGNGLGRRRELGIDPATGYQQTAFAPRTWQDDGQFRAVTWHRFIDGVFVPNYHSGSVQIDSAKHTFDETFGAGGAYGSIWVRAAEPPSNEYANDPSYWVYVVGSDKAFMPDRRGLLCMHANAGITFDLNEIRLAYPDSTPSEFHAVAGMFNAGLHTEWADGWADIWILVDGKLKLKREKILSKDGGPFNVDVALKPSDRFLTIISTDGGYSHGTARDWIVFGDPVLRMTSGIPEETKP